MDARRREAGLRVGLAVRILLAEEGSVHSEEEDFVYIRRAGQGQAHVVGCAQGFKEVLCVPQDKRGLLVEHGEGDRAKQDLFGFPAGGLFIGVLVYRDRGRAGIVQIAVVALPPSSEPSILLHTVMWALHFVMLT